MNSNFRWEDILNFTSFFNFYWCGTGQAPYQSSIRFLFLIFIKILFQTKLSYPSRLKNQVIELTKFWLAGELRLLFEADMFTLGICLKLIWSLQVIVWNNIHF